MKLKRLKIIGVLIAFLISFPLHFLYDKAPCFLTSVISPVNESIMEHMKIIFTAIILSGVIQKIIVKVKHYKYKNVCISNYVAACLSIIFFLAIYLPIYYSLGENLIITIILMFITYVVSQIITLKVISFKDLHMENVTILLVLITYLIFGLLTYYPIKIDLFKDPITMTYGIKK